MSATNVSPFARHGNITSNNASATIILFPRLRESLRIFRALENSRVLHISMNARWRMNQLLSIVRLKKKWKSKKWRKKYTVKLGLR